MYEMSRVVFERTRFFDFEEDTAFFLDKFGEEDGVKVILDISRLPKTINIDLLGALEIDYLSIARLHLGVEYYMKLLNVIPETHSMPEDQKEAANYMFKDHEFQELIVASDGNHSTIAKFIEYLKPGLDEKQRTFKAIDMTSLDVCVSRTAEIMEASNF